MLDKRFYKKHINETFNNSHFYFCFRLFVARASFAKFSYYENNFKNNDLRVNALFYTCFCVYFYFCICVCFCFYFRFYYYYYVCFRSCCSHYYYYYYYYYYVYCYLYFNFFIIVNNKKMLNENVA